MYNMWTLDAVDQLSVDQQISILMIFKINSFGPGDTFNLPSIQHTL